MEEDEGRLERGGIWIHVANFIVLQQKLTQHCKHAVTQSLSHVQLFVTPWTAACQGLFCPWDFSGKNITGVGCHFLLQEIFPARD